MSISRRALLIGAAGAMTAGVGALGLVETGVIPGRAGLHSALGLTGEAGVIPDVDPGPVVNGSFTSKARLGIEVGYSIMSPPDSPGPLPICLYLGGRGFTHRSMIGDLGVNRFLAVAVDFGTPPFAVVTVDGGEEYWHRRSDGDDPQAMITDELLPLVAAAGHPVDRIGLAGLSMGGYGALLLAEVLGHQMVSSVAAMSPALFSDFEASTDGAFDSEADFAGNDVIARAQQGQLDHIAVRLDCGRDDPFSEGTERLMNVLGPQVAGAIQPGLHDVDYWIRVLPEQLTFTGANLASP